MNLHHWHHSYFRKDFQLLLAVKDLNSTVAKRGSVFIGLMTPNSSIWLDMKGCLNEVIIISLQEVVKRPLKGNIPVI